MASPNPEQFWALLVESRLADSAALAKLRQEFEGLPFPPGTTAAGASEVIARWLVKRGLISEWQSRRLLRGEKGPFFLGDYRLLDRHDTGRGGTVFRARHEPTGRLVGITVLNNKYCQQPEVWSDILKRTKAATEAGDPALTKTWALEKAGSQRFVLSDDVIGVPLADELAKRGPIPAPEAAAIVLTVARAVAELHRLGVVHGAISLDTVRREPVESGEKKTEGAIRLLQFPLVSDPHVVPPRPELDSAEAVARLGTRASFLPPEALKGGRPSDTSGDVYALGALFSALLAGAPPNWQGDAQKTLSHVAAGNRPAALPAGKVPVEVATLVTYLTAPNPADRYPTAAEAADAVAACLGRPAVSSGLPNQRPMIVPGSGPIEALEPTVPIAVVETTQKAGKPIAARKPPRRRLLIPALGGIGLLIASIGAAFVLLPPAAESKSKAGSKSGETVKPSAEVARPDRTTPAGDPPPGPAASGSEATPPQDTPAGGARVAPAVPVVTALVDGGAEKVPFLGPQPEGPPPALRYLPPGSQLVLLARPAEALATAEGGLFVRSLGPRAAAALEKVASMAGCAPEAIAEIQAGWQAGGPDEVIGGVLVRGVGPLPVAADEQARAAALGVTEAEEIDGETLLRGKGFAAWLPSDAGGSVLVFGTEELVRQTIAFHVSAAGAVAAGESIEASLPRDLEELVGMLDSTRHLTLFGSPEYLLHDGRPVLSGPLSKLVEPLGWFFGESVRAAALSLHFGPDCYLELDAMPPAGTPSRQLATRLAGNVAALAEKAEEYCNALDPHPYGRKLVLRLPRMLGIVADHSHSGAEGRGVIVNAWLPEHAPHNIALAAELALEQVPRADGADGVPVADASRGRPAGALEALGKPISLVFVKDTLEKSIQMIADEIGVEMEILGSDLQLEGITKNQSFGLAEKEKPAADILRAILAKANPDGKLVYVIRKTGDGEKIEITTRAAVDKRGDTLAPGQDNPTTETTEKE